MKGFAWLRSKNKFADDVGDHFERDAPGMHATDTIDYGIVVSRRDDAGTR